MQRVGDEAVKKTEIPERKLANLLLEEARNAPLPEPAERLYRVIDALERRTLPAEEDCNWLVAALSDYADSLGRKPLDALLGLRGRGSLSKYQHRFRESHYRLQMALHVAAGYSDSAAARKVQKEMRSLFDRTNERSAIPRHLRGGKHIDDEYLGRLFRSWKRAPTPELVLLAYEDAIASLRAERERRGSS